MCRCLSHNAKPLRKMNFKKLFFAALCTVIFLGLKAQAYEITFQVDDYDNDTLLVGYYYGDRQLLLDTVYATKKGKFILKGDEPLKRWYVYGSDKT